MRKTIQKSYELLMQVQHQNFIAVCIARQKRLMREANERELKRVLNKMRRRG